MSTLSQPLLDRLEIIELSGYLLEEKVEIACNHIIPRLRKNYNLKSGDLIFTRDVIAKIVENYTSESGVRQLEKALSAIIRKTVMAKVQGTPTLNVLIKSVLKNYWEFLATLRGIMRVMILQEWLPVWLGPR